MENNTTKQPLIKNKLLFYTGLAYFIILLLFIGLRVAFLLIDFGDMPLVWKDRLFTICTQIIIMGAVPVLLIWWFTRPTKQEFVKRFSLNTVNWQSILYTIALGVCFYFLTIAISSFFNGIIGMLGYAPPEPVKADVTESPAVYFLLAVLFTAILPGIFEEVSHRGMLLGGLKSQGSNLRAVILCGLLFGLMHLNITQFFYTAIIGMLLAQLTIITKSIIPAIIIHIVSNFLGTYFSHADKNDWWLGGFYDSINGFFASNNVFVVFIAVFLIMSLIVFVILGLFIRLFIERGNKDFKDFVKKFKAKMQADGQADGIDFNNQALMLSYYRQVQLLKRQSEAQANGMTDSEYGAYLKKHGMLNVMLADERVSMAKPSFWENFFFYASITLGVIVTIFTFVWGVL
ncbi:MAG: CPBP family intramembrane metalloprotease [Firmicutes bacterium]|nr:CPBP family intramembrane metalloprotease [Bacillota bacterium]